jgi:hypothetical protein
MFTGEPYGYSIDWWAAGTIIYEMIYRMVGYLLNVASF